MTQQNTIPIWRSYQGVRGCAGSHERAPFVIVGAGPVGLTAALDLARKGHPVVVLNRLDFIPAGSKAICFAKRTLDIWDRLGVGEDLMRRGVTWNVGKVFWGASSEPIYQFDMQPVKNQKMPGFINLQQYIAEEMLVEALGKYPNVSLRWGHEVVGVKQNDKHAEIDVRAPDGDYRITADWLIACDGNKSAVRGFLNLDFEGRVFEDNFLIVDIRTDDQRPSERWFWFDPPFNADQSALFHKQPDGIYRLDFQLGWDIDREAFLRPETIERYVRGMLGPDIKYTPEWISIYTFQCRRMARFVHDRVIFAGDSAHLVSPFGARGCNGGIADIDNLIWKLDLIVKGAAPETLLASYDHEAIVTADENIKCSTRSTDFLTPKSAVSRAYRDAVLSLARQHAFARPFVNSGRLSVAVHYPDSPLNTRDQDGWRGGVRPGSPALDAPLKDGWLLDHFGEEFVAIGLECAVTLPAGVRKFKVEDAEGPEGLIRSRYDLEPGSLYLVRPDQYIAARWRKPTTAAIEAAVARAKGG